MERKLKSLGRTALERENFVDHFFGNAIGEDLDDDPDYFDYSGYYDSFEENEYFMYGDMKKGFLLGPIKYGVFVPSHYAPKNIIKGYELIKNLGKEKEIPAAIAITNDLAAMIKRISEWELMDLNFTANFRGKETKKKLAHNKHPEIEHLLTGLLDEYMEEQLNFDSNLNDQKEGEQKIGKASKEINETPPVKIKRKVAAPPELEDEF